MFVGIARFELFLVSQPHSLKEKRAILNRVKAHLRNRLPISVAEVDFQEVWQRAGLGICCINSERLVAQRLLEQASDLLATCHDLEVTSEEWEVQSW
jgi:uncharacterized protein